MTDRPKFCRDCKRYANGKCIMATAWISVPFDKKACCYYIGKKDGKK